MTTYAPFSNADQDAQGRSRIRVRCPHCATGRHWFPLKREVACPKTGAPLRITMTAIVHARQKIGERRAT